MSRQSTMKAAILVERTVRAKLKLFYWPKTKFMSTVKIAILVKNMSLPKCNYFFSEYCNLYKQKYGFHEMKIAMWPKGKP